MALKYTSIWGNIFVTYIYRYILNAIFTLGYMSSNPSILSFRHISKINYGNLHYYSSTKNMSCKIMLSLKNRK